VANDVSQGVFGGDENRVTVIDADGAQDWPRMGKAAVAKRLAERIAQALATLPGGRTPTKADWTRLSRAFQADLDDRIERLTKLRDQLTGCIGCGCDGTGIYLYFNGSKESCSRFNTGVAQAIASTDICNTQLHAI
jgi:hypothetical protein